MSSTVSRYIAPLSKCNKSTCAGGHQKIMPEIVDHTSVTALDMKKKKISKKGYY